MLTNRNGCVETVTQTQKHTPKRIAESPKRLHSMLKSLRLVEETRFPARIVRYALNQLTEINAITGQMSFSDARQSLYTTTSSISSPDTCKTSLMPELKLLA